MRYIAFTIRNYKGAVGPIRLNVTRPGILPLIGLNESGKTTLLEAIFAFDDMNDALIEGRHLRDTASLYQRSASAVITAEIEVTEDEVDEVLQGMTRTFTADDLKELGKLAVELQNPFDPQHPDIDLVAQVAKLPDGTDDALREKCNKHLSRTRFVEALDYGTKPTTFTISRHLNSPDDSPEYTIEDPVTPPPNPGAKEDLVDTLARNIIMRCPYIHYFDDFRDRVPDKISTKPQITNVWQGIINQLLFDAGTGTRIHRLAGMDDRKRNTAIARAERHLNNALTNQWAALHLEDESSLNIRIIYDPPASEEESANLSFQVSDLDSKGDPTFFRIEDRSKGFYWFFNFVMRLEFDPRRVSEKQGAVYLLDEPGSYLHGAAQNRLCEKLRTLAAGNAVVFSTHSHHLLDPQQIPFASIHICEKDQDGSITALPIGERPSGQITRRLAYQPVLDALQVRPAIIDFTDRKTLLVEGITDFFAFTIFAPSDKWLVVPSVGANSLPYHASLLMAWGVDYWVLWDNDPEGRDAMENASSKFGKDEAERRFRLLPPKGRSKKRILQDLFAGGDIALIKNELSLPKGTAFAKMLAAWFYSDSKEEILASCSAETKSNFAEVFLSLADA